jgi:hypothetical protein
MQPDYTFALQYQLPTNTDRAAAVKARLPPRMSWDPKARDCVLWEPREPDRLVKLADDLVTLTMAETGVKLSAPDILADVVASNLGFVRGALSSAGKGPFRLCGDSLQLLRDVLPAQPQAPTTNSSEYQTAKLLDVNLQRG